LNRNPNGD
jgi:hypothetical protein